MLLTTFWPFRRRVRHPFFPDVAADAAAMARRPSQALAGMLGELRTAAARGATARRAVYVMTEGEPLSEIQREELWRLFQVPIYVLLMREGRLMAWECEAQCGLHIAGGGAAIVCACGRPGATMMMGQAARHAAA